MTDRDFGGSKHKPAEDQINPQSIQRVNHSGQTTRISEIPERISNMVIPVFNPQEISRVSDLISKHRS